MIARDAILRPVGVCMSDYTLYNYFRSSTSVRVRVALNLKGLAYRYQGVHLVEGQQHSEDYRRLNPEGLVPALAISGHGVLSQSLAIMEYLDETHPEPPLMPADPLGRARVRSLSQLVACDIHPVNNLRVLNRLREKFSADSDDIKAWFRHWASRGFETLEVRLHDAATGRFCHGDSPTIADICLFAQTLNNRRFGVDMAPFPKISEIFDACMAMPEFQAATPDAQPDAQ